MGSVLERVGYRSGVFQSLCWPVSEWCHDPANLKAIFGLLSIGCKTAFFLQLVSSLIVWLEKMLDKISIFLNLLRFDL